MTRRCCLSVISLLLFACSQGEASDFSKFLHQVFEQNTGRQPTGMEMNYQSNLMRNQGPLENYIQLCSSDDYFVSRAQRNYEVYVASLYRTFLMREARPDELRYWVNQFAQPGMNRQTMLRNFLRAYTVTQLPSFPAECRPTPYRVPTSTYEIASELVAQVTLFTQTFGHEVAGTRYGRSVLDQASRLLTLSSQYRDLIRSRRTTAEQLQIATDNLERGLQSVEAEFYRIPGASQVSRDILRRISQLLSAARLAHPPQSTPRPGDVWPPGGQSSLGRDVESVRRQLQSFAYGLQHYKRRGPAYDRLTRDVQSLLVQIDALSLMVRQGQSNLSLRRTMGSVLTQADAISRDSEQVDLDIQRGWWTIRQNLDRIADSLGISHAWNQVSQPVILGHPAWQGLGSQPRPAVGVPARNRDVVDLADQLLVKIGDAQQSLIPLARRNNDVARLRAGLVELQNKVYVLRQTAVSSGYGSRLAQAAQQTMDQYQDLGRLFATVVGQDPTLNTPTFYQMGEIIQQLQGAVSGVPR